MKALSVRQPWASLIAEGRKTIEVRTWRTSHRGPLLICSSLRTDAGATAEQPKGVALAVVDLVDCRPLMPADAPAAHVPWREGVFAWELRLLYRVEEIPVKGRLGFFEVDDVSLTPIRPPQKMRP